MTQDRTESGSLPITHDFLATMLGTDQTYREPGSRCSPEERDHRVHPWCSDDRKPQENLKTPPCECLRGYPTIR